MPRITITTHDDAPLSADQWAAVIDQLPASIREPLTKAKHAHVREPTRERYLRQLARDMHRAGRALDDAACELVDTYVAATFADGDHVNKSRRGTAALWDLVRPGRPAPMLLTPRQVAALADLIDAHYRASINVGFGGDYQITRAESWRWKISGVVRADVNIGAFVSDAFVAGRLFQILNDGTSLADMRQMAQQFPLPRVASLALQSLSDQVRFDLAGGVGYRMRHHAGQLVQGRNAAAVHAIVQAYRAGDLRETPTNRTGLDPDEIRALETRRGVDTWRGLAGELRNRMAAEDRMRDWERVAVSVTRQSHNIGAISAIAEQEIESIIYDVHADACDHCKTLYLDADGRTPKVFSTQALVATIAATGGANYGRTASAIGDPAHGWVPNALAHPWCQCRPRPYMPA